MDNLVVWLMLGVPVALWLWSIAEAVHHRIQARQAQEIQAHSVEVETTDDGAGYRLVE